MIRRIPDSGVWPSGQTPVCNPGQTGRSDPAWHEVFPGVLRFRDSCNVYAVHGPEGCLLVDAGTGLWLDHLDELPAEPVVLACTHFFRDHSAGAVRASRRGIPVFVPEGEKEIFADPALHFLRRESYIVYDNY